MDGEDQPRPTIIPWPLGLAQRFSRPGLTLGVGTGALVAIAMWVFGAYDPSSATPYWASRAQVVSLAIAYPALFGYMIGMITFAAQRAQQYLNALRPILTADADRVAERLNRPPRVNLWAATFAGIVIGLLNIDRETVFGLRETPAQAVDYVIAGASFLIWILILRFTYLTVRNARVFSQLGALHTRVDLYRPSTLRPFAQIGILYLLIVMGALALSPLQSLDASFRFENYSWAFAIGIPAAVVLPLLAMGGIRKATLAAKQADLAQLDAAIAAASRDLDASATQSLNALLDRRAYVREQHGWPMDVRMVSRAAFYVVIPPLAWVGAALVERAIEAFIGS
jgi:hypothetical protein